MPASAANTAASALLSGAAATVATNSIIATRRGNNNNNNNNNSNNNRWTGGAAARLLMGRRTMTKKHICMKMRRMKKRKRKTTMKMPKPIASRRSSPGGSGASCSSSVGAAMELEPPIQFKLMMIGEPAEEAPLQTIRASSLQTAKRCGAFTRLSNSSRKEGPLCHQLTPFGSTLTRSRRRIAEEEEERGWSAAREEICPRCYTSCPTPQPLLPPPWRLRASQPSAAAEGIFTPLLILSQPLRKVSASAHHH